MPGRDVTCGRCIGQRGRLVRSVEGQQGGLWVALLLRPVLRVCVVFVSFVTWAPCRCRFNIAPSGATAAGRWDGEGVSTASLSEYFPRKMTQAVHRTHAPHRPHVTLFGRLPARHVTTHSQTR